MLYPQSLCLESEQFPFRAFLYSTSPHRPRTVHYHDFVELVYVVGGRGEHLYKDAAFPVSEGDLFVVPPFVPHDYNVIGHEPLDVYNIIFAASFLGGELQPLSNETPLFGLTPGFETHLKLTAPEGRELRQRLVRIVGEFDAKALGYRISIKALFIEMLVWLSRKYEERLIVAPSGTGPSKPIAAACALIERHYAEEMTLEDLCRRCGMSQPSFVEMFKQGMGKTFIEYRNEVRVRAAPQPLRETDEKIVAIAESVGIRDLSHFYKLFKKHIGQTPRDYRLKFSRAAGLPSSSHS